jgi:hypothetical protein
MRKGVRDCGLNSNKSSHSPSSCLDSSSPSNIVKHRCQVLVCLSDETQNLFLLKNRRFYVNFAFKDRQNPDPHPRLGPFKWHEGELSMTTRFLLEEAFFLNDGDPVHFESITWKTL